ncbi:transposase [Pseudomonas aeruginosa]|uniref:transposase n=1 Tax=Pseudomonas aeruginosa TaxID=287 RepID=UPI003FD4BCFE
MRREVSDRGSRLATGIGPSNSIPCFPPQIRRIIYATNAIESINTRLREIIKTRGDFPRSDSATKLIWLAQRNITADWGRAAKDRKEAMKQFPTLNDNRFVRAIHIE